MDFLEKDLEDIIFDSGIEKCAERGLDFSDNNGTLLRQVKIGNYGIADLVHYEKMYDCIGSINGKHELDIWYEITVIELKKDLIGVSAFMQAVRYTIGIKRYLEKRGISSDRYKLNIILIGKQVDSTGDACYLPDLFSTQTSENVSVRFYVYKYGLNGILFNEKSGYSLVHDGF